jgi:flagellar assembly protein FliH
MRAGEVVIDGSDGVISLSPTEAAERINTLVEAALAAPAPTS